MEDESSDILGQQTKPVLRANTSDNQLSVSLVVRVAIAFAVLLVLYVVIMRIWFRVLVWKERSYKLAMRRRHGIPDNDHRPFNVAYAAVLRARQEKEAAQKAKATQPVPPHDRRSAQIGQTVRQRFGLQTTAEVPRASSYSSRFPGAYFAEGTPAGPYPEQVATVGPSGYVSQSQQTSASRRYESGAPSFNARRASRKDLDLGTGVGSQKRGFVEDKSTEEEGVTKRSRRENGFTGNETDPDDAVWQEEELPQRVAKRYLFDEDENEDNLIERQPRDKRARKVSLDKGIQAQEEDSDDMDVDEELEDEIDDLPSMHRGKKRDRAEAGSTFGGDDDESGPEHDTDLKSKRRRRKHSTVGKGKSGAFVTRGQKRDRDLGDDESEVETGDETSRISRKKRGKRASLQDDEMSEHSTTRSQTSSGSRNRKIGEEWNSNGIRWKLGPNGQRLRQALVKKTRQRFPMPEDSQHPDRQADFEVYVETWLDEEEYRDAKERHLLAGQDTPKRSDSKLAVDVQTHASGKNLLWSSTTTPVDSPVSYSPVSDRGLPANQRIVRISLISSNSPRSNPFDQLPTHNMRRISSITRTASAGNIGSPGLADTTNSSPHARFKSYSKLEKQELEAQALMRLRELKNKKEAETNQARAEQAAKDKENLDKPSTLTITPTIPSITVTAPTDVPKQTTQSMPSLFNPSKPAEDSSKPTDAPKPQPLFGFPSASAPAQPSTDAAKPAEIPKPPLFGNVTSSTLSFPPAAPVPAAPKSVPSSSAPSSSVPPPSLSFGPSFASSSGPVMTQPTSNLFPPATAAPVAATANKSDQAQKSPFSFNFPSSNPASSTTARPNTASAAPDSGMDTATSKPVFSFGYGATKPTTEQKAPEAAPQLANGNNALLGRLGPPATTATSSTSPQHSLFNFAKPITNTAAPNPFTTPTSQPTSNQVPPSSVSTGNPAAQPKFNFGFGSSANTPSAVNNTAAPTTTSSAPSSNPFESTVKSGPMVSFNPLTPSSGTKADKPPVDGSAASKAAPDPSPFGFKAPAPSSTSIAPGNDTSKGVAMSGFGAPNPFNANGSNMSHLFGSSAFGTKPTENKVADSSGTSQASKSLFNFGPTGQSSSNVSGPQSSNIFGNMAAAKPAPASSSLFGALGQRPTNAFGSASSLGANNNVFGSSNNAGNSSSSSAPANIFGSQPNRTGSSSQTTNIFGNSGTGASGMFGSTKPPEASKPAFSLTSAANGATSTAAASYAPKPSFHFSNPAPNSNSSSSGVSVSNATTSMAPQFPFNLGPAKSSAGSNSSRPSVFDAPASTSGTQSTVEVKPSPFSFGGSFASNSAPSGTGSIFGAPNPTEQK